MSSVAQSMPAWQNSLDPALLQRLTRPLREPCLLLRTDLSRRIFAALLRLQGLTELGTAVLRRRGIKPGSPRGAVPIVDACWVAQPWPTASPPASAIERIIVSATAVRVIEHHTLSFAAADSRSRGNAAEPSSLARPHTGHSAGTASSAQPGQPAEPRAAADVVSEVAGPYSAATPPRLVEGAGQHPLAPAVIILRETAAAADTAPSPILSTASMSPGSPAAPYGSAAPPAELLVPSFRSTAPSGTVPNKTDPPRARVRPANLSPLLARRAIDVVASTMAALGANRDVLDPGQRLSTRPTVSQAANAVSPQPFGEASTVVQGEAQARRATAAVVRPSGRTRTSEPVSAPAAVVHARSRRRELRTNPALVMAPAAAPSQPGEQVGDGLARRSAGSTRSDVTTVWPGLQEVRTTRPTPSITPLPPTEIRSASSPLARVHANAGEQAKNHAAAPLVHAGPPLVAALQAAAEAASRQATATPVRATRAPTAERPDLLPAGGPSAAPPTSPPAVINIDELADKVQRKLVRQLAEERIRRGHLR